MEDDFSAPTRRGAPLIQAALALLVAGTLVAFSVLAFRTGFSEDRGRDVTATDIGSGGGAVVLPGLGGSESAPEEEPNATTNAAGDTAGIAITSATDEPVVLGTRVKGTTSRATGDDHRGRGIGHDRARGQGHHKDDDKGNHEGDGSWDGRESAAREEDDDADDHSDDDGRDDDSNSSRSRSDRSHSGKRHRGSRGHSGSGHGGSGHSRGSN